jgi:hypothetical protein
VAEAKLERPCEGTAYIFDAAGVLRLLVLLLLLLLSF